MLRIMVIASVGILNAMYGFGLKMGKYIIGKEDNVKNPLPLGGGFFCARNKKVRIKAIRTFISYPEAL